MACPEDGDTTKTHEAKNKGFTTVEHEENSKETSISSPDRDYEPSLDDDQQDFSGADGYNSGGEQKPKTIGQSLPLKKRRIHKKRKVKIPPHKKAKRKRKDSYSSSSSCSSSSSSSSSLSQESSEDLLSRNEIWKMTKSSKENSWKLHNDLGKSFSKNLKEYYTKTEVRENIVEDLKTLTALCNLIMRLKCI